jgi:hypothetical protein
LSRGFLGVPISIRNDVADIDEQTDDFDPSLVPFLLQANDFGQLGFASRSAASALTEQDAPGSADPFAKADASVDGILLEIRRGLADCDAHRKVPRIGNKRLPSEGTMVFSDAKLRRGQC